MARYCSTTDHSSYVDVRAKGEVTRGTLLSQNLAFDKLLLILYLYLVCLR